MKAIPDSCTLIHLIKTGLLDILLKIFDEVWIGEIVYFETVERGKEEQKSDSLLLERRIEELSGIKVKELEDRENYEKEKLYFVGPGETNVYKMAIQNRSVVAITSDTEAYKKLVRRGVNVIRSDEILLEALKKKIISFDELTDSLIRLRTVGGTTEERIAFLIKKALEVLK
jgi:predicted nucleic acid-binding protein